MPQNQASQVAVDDEIDLRALAITVWRGKLTVSVAFVACCIIAGFHLLVTPPIYQADAMVQIDSSRGSLALPESMQELLSDASPVTAAEIEILRSRKVLGDAAAELNLSWVAQPRLAPILGSTLARFDLPIPGQRYGRKGETITLNYFQVPPDWVGREIEVTSLGNSEFKVKLPDGTEQLGEVGQLLVVPSLGFALNIEVLNAPSGREFVLSHGTELAAISSLGQNLRVSERGRQTGILTVSLTDVDPREAERRLNAIITAYLVQNITKGAAEARSSLTFVEEQIPVAAAEVRDAEVALNQFRESQASIDLDFETESLLTEATRIEDELRVLATKEEELKDRFTTIHPVYRQLLDNRTALIERRDSLQAEIRKLPATQREVLNLTRELEIAQATYVELLNRAQELKVLSASEVGSVRIVDDAVASPVPVEPRKSRILVLAGLMGLIAGVAIVLIRQSFRRGVDSPREIEAAGLPVFATVHLYEGGEKRKKDQAYLLPALTDPNDVVVESIRSLRTGLYFGMLDASSRSIVFTSSAPQAGKSFLSSNLAVVAAQAGQKVCLIDADMRRSKLHRIFQFDRRVAGLSTYLSDEANLEAILQEGPVSTLSIVTAGAAPPNPSDLLMRPKLATLFEELAAIFDLVIFDAPPVLAVTDAVVLAKHAGTTLAVARHLVTPVGEIDAVRRNIEAAQAKLAGVVLNGFDPRQARSEHGRYGYEYGYTARYSYNL